MNIRESEDNMEIGKVWKTGNSIVITIDKKLEQKSGFKPGDLVELIVKDVGKLEVRKVNFKRAEA